MKRAALLAVGLLVSPMVRADLVVSCNDNKFDLSVGKGRVVENPPPDTVTVLDFATFPPRVTHIEGVPNSVFGPPCNVAITPDERLALVANACKRVRYDADHKLEIIPDNVVTILDLTARPPIVVGKVTVGKQPSGIALNREGTLALVANRGDGTVSVLSIHGREVKHLGAVKVCEPEDELVAAAITPDGKTALVNVNRKHTVKVLRIDGTKVELTDVELPVYWRPYRIEIAPDGKAALTAGVGLNGVNADAITVIDLAADPIRTTDHVAVGTTIESFDISPDGSLVAAVVMNGSNQPPDSPYRTEHGRLVLLTLAGTKLTRVQEIAIGRIPQGVSFSPDGRHVLVQMHPVRELWVYAVEGRRLKDTGHRIKVPGMPSAIRTAETPR